MNKDNERKNKDTNPSGKTVAKSRGDNRTDRSGVKHSVDKRNRSLRTISVVTTIVFIVMVLVFNIVFDQLLGSRLKWDWTASSMYSIGDVTEEILDTLDKNIEIIGLFSEDSQFYRNYADIMPLLEEYEKKSKGRVQLKFVDPDLDPTLLQTLDPDGMMKPATGSFVVYSPDTGKAKNLIRGDLYQLELNQNYQTVVTGIKAEQGISGAIRYVQSENTPVVYFTTGHEELDYATQYETMVGLLRNNNFDVKSLEMFNVSEIPQDCAVLVIADPKIDITSAEREVIDTWLRTGGRLMVISSFSSSEFPQLNTLLAEYNLQLSNNKIRDDNLDYQFQQDPYSMRVNAPAGLFTSTTIERYTLALNARGVDELMNTKEWLQVQPVLTTSDQGVAEAGGIAANATGPAVQTIGMLAEHIGWIDQSTVTEPTRVVVLGSSDLFREDIIVAFGTTLYNYALFYNSVNWLSGTSVQDTLLIDPKIPTSYAIARGTTTSIVATSVFVMILIPLALLLTALIVYRRRKHL